MIIILKRVSAKTKKHDVVDFLYPEVKGSWFSKRGKIQSILVLTQRDTQTRAVHHHILADIVPDAVAERVIKKLNRKMMIGTYIAVCEYKVRNWHNDPRCNHDYAKAFKRVNDKRVAERRGQYEEIISEEPTIISKKAFHTKGW